MNARHIIHIREALWQRPERGACVMVGAGLSRQTELGNPTEVRPPTWGQLALLLQQDLRCGDPGSKHVSSAESVTARDCSRLAQQYKATFGQSALESFLLARVPDGEPDSVHERLLRLPWADVFSTNWDTLLEKAARKVFDRTYDPVLCSADLATTVAPRIVKLHGSFPSNRPFVITEEDYRTYPIQFAPFVNTVQQALMESTFLLVGFSGDDPNFLHWCGWVRDHLGAAAPRLYLAGVLDLDRPSRLMLEERGVIPIDLASEVSDAPSREARHRRAIEWILGSLEAGESREQRWPLPPPHPIDNRTPDIAPPVPRTDQPRATPEAPSSSATPEALAAEVKEVAAIWRHNRRIYPGWPVLPFSKRGYLFNSTEAWIQWMLKVAPSLEPTDRLVVVRELVGRAELLMNPLTPDLSDAATKALNAVEVYIADTDDLTEERLGEIDEDRTALMLSLLVASRHEFDRTGFDEWTRRLESIVRLGTSAFHHLQHERCLWKLMLQDFEGSRQLLTAWRTERSDAMWALRKAALMVDSGDVDGGLGLALSTLQRTERDWSRDRRVVTAARLGWALHWRQATNWARWFAELRQENDSIQPDDDLWARLAAYGGDARSDFNAYAGQMTKAQREDTPWTFDLRRKGRITLYDPVGPSARFAVRFMRLLELSGLPSGIPGSAIASHHIERASRLVAPFIPAYAARLLLLAGSVHEKSLDAVLSQTNLARMSVQEASELFDAAQSARDHFLRLWVTGEKDAEFYRHRAETAIEIMSRCVVRHGVGTASETLVWALRYSRPRQWVDNQFWSCVGRLWERSWKAMDIESKIRAIPDVLRTPIPEEAFITDQDPGDLLLGEHLRINRSDIDELIWSSCVHQICSALGGNEYSRRLAFDRLHPIARKQLLSETEEHDVALSLWGTVHQESEGLPKIRHVDDWMYLILPEPETGIAERRFRSKWIGRRVNDATSETGAETIRNIAKAWDPSPLGERAIHLNKDEQAWFWNFVEGWLRREASQSLRGGTSRDPAIRLLVDLLTQRPVPESILNQLAENAAPAEVRPGPIVEHWESPENENLVMVAAAALGAVDSGETESRLRLAARSTDARESLAAWKALEWWITQSGQDAGIPVVSPSVEIVREIGIAISASQPSGLLGALRAACSVYRIQNAKFVEAVHSRIIQGLRQLRSELDYQSGALDRRFAEELPLLRHWSVWLAWIMTESNKGDEEVIGSWISAGDDDPLVIVRFVREWNSASPVGRDVQ